MGYWTTKAYANKNWRWNKSHSFGWEAKQLQEWDSALFMGCLLCLHSFPLHHPICRQVRRRQSTAGASSPVKERLPALVWNSKAALAASQAQKIPVMHWKETPPIAVLGLGQGSSISHWEQKTVRHYLTLFVLSNTFCFLSELAWKLNQHSFLKE